MIASPFASTPYGSTATSMAETTNRTAPDPVQGAMYMSAAALTMALVGTSVKWATGDLPPPVVVFFRNLFGVLVLLPFVLQGSRIDLRTTRLGMHLLRCLLGIGAMYFYFFALSGLPLAEAIVLNFTSPLFIPIIARLWLKERLGSRSVIATVVGFIGAAFVMRPEADHFTKYSLFALISAVFASASLVGVRKLTSTEPAGRVVFYFAFGSSILTAGPLAWSWQTPEPTQWIPLLLTGALASCAQFLLTRGYARAPAAIAAVFHYLTVPTAALLGWLFWGEKLSIHTAIGAVLICAAGIWVSLPAKKPTVDAATD